MAKDWTGITGNIGSAICVTTLIICLYLRCDHVGEHNHELAILQQQAQIDTAMAITPVTLDTLYYQGGKCGQ